MDHERDGVRHSARRHHADRVDTEGGSLSERELRDNPVRLRSLLFDIRSFDRRQLLNRADCPLQFRTVRPEGISSFQGLASNLALGGPATASPERCYRRELGLRRRRLRYHADA